MKSVRYISTPSPLSRNGHFCIPVFSPLSLMMLQVLCSCYLSSTKCSRQSQDDVRLDPALQFILFFVSCVFFLVSLYVFVCFHQLILNQNHILYCEFQQFICLSTKGIISHSKILISLISLFCCINSGVSAPEYHVAAWMLRWRDHMTLSWMDL